MKLFIETNEEGIKFLNKISLNNKNMYIDGTVYDSSSGMNFSCAGIKFNSLNICIEEPDDEDKLISTPFSEIKLKEKGTLLKLPNDLTIWIDNQVIDDLNQDDYYNKLEIIVVDLENSLFYAEKVN